MAKRLIIKKPLKDLDEQEIYVCGYYDEVIKVDKIVKHLKTIHNEQQPEVIQIITKVVMV